MSKKKEHPDNYIEWHEKSGLKVGDYVKILRAAKSGENDWFDTWEDSMDRFIGLVGIITADKQHRGFEVSILNTEYSYPFFVLEKKIIP